MAEDTDRGEDEAGGYDPRAPTPPSREPPYRSTAPQSDYTVGQVGLGFAVLVVGLLLTVGLPLVVG